MPNVHVGDAQLSGPVLAAGAVVSLVGMGRTLRHLDDRAVPRIALVSSAFFAITLWHLPLPVPGTSIHLVLVGLLGLLLGWDTFLAVGLVIFFQALLLGHGGVTAWGVNTLAMSLPGPIVAWLVRAGLHSPNAGVVGTAGFCLGSGSVLLATLLVAGGYALSRREYLAYLPAYFLAQLPLMAIEGIVTASAVLFFARVRPELIGRRDPLLPRSDA